MKLYNTLTRSLQDLKPIDDNRLKIYTCGPTVYDYQHIGNYSGYIYWDVLVRYLAHQGLAVDRVMNITDVGHLVSDDDEGEDKLEKGAKREGKTAREVADFYTSDFYEGMEALNMTKPKYTKATDFIPQQLDMVKVLLDKHFAYQTEQAIYFDVTKLDDYGKLTGQKLTDKEVAARSEVVTDTNKHNPHDFALWFFTVGRFADHEMHWPSPWGDGFPGWHLECSAIVHAALGDPIDIHTGGIDHIGTHHTNEIAQTEAAYGNQLANIWLHNNHLMVDGKKISKSLGNGITLKDLQAKGFSPLDFKLFVLQGHYSHQGNFSWENLEAARNSLKSFYAWSDLQFQDGESSKLADNYKEALNLFTAALDDNLGTPGVIAQLNGMVKRTEELGIDSRAIKEAAETIDSLLGLGLSGRPDITQDQKDKIAKRQTAKNNRNFAAADELRKSLESDGIGLKDREDKTVWFRL